MSHRVAITDVYYEVKISFSDICCRNTVRNQASESTSAMPRDIDVIPHQNHIEATRRSQSTRSFQDKPEEAKDQLNLFIC